MSGFKLRALLEEADFSSVITQHFNNKNDSKAKLAGDAYDPTSASLLNSNNIWNDSEDDFNLEYMDLDEFLSETGLVDTNFANISAPPPMPSPNTADALSTASKSPADPVSGLDQMLASTLAESPPTSQVSLSDGEPVSPPALPSDSTTPAANSHESNSNAVQIVKKRKYSEDGEGLGEAAVVVVPGQEGFDPAHAKFTPEDLQPQPIIKKSKKQFVPEENKDDKYWRRRNKNNVAAKRSREARRAKENQIIMRAGFLERENDKLVKENEQLTAENRELKKLVEKLRGGKQ